MVNQLERYEVMGRLYSQSHPQLPLRIYNYTDKVQYEQLWDDVTMSCRGLVIDTDTMEIVARPFRKFFNLSEQRTEVTDLYEVYEKLDGSLIILFWYKDQWVVASRGSFESIYAKKAEELLQQYDLDKLNKEATYCFEVIFPENRIVVDYGDREEIILTGVINTETGQEYAINTWGLPCARSFNLDTPLETIQHIIQDNEEGYVIKFSNGERCKIKGETYIRLHGIMSNVSTTAIWKHLKENRDIGELISGVPDEFFNKVQEYVEELKYKHRYIRIKTEAKYNVLSNIYTSRKEFATRISDEPDKHLLFALWDGKSIDDIIWKDIKPEYKKLSTTHH